MGIYIPYYLFIIIVKIKPQAILIFLFLFIISNSIILSQSNTKKGFKFGIELKNYLTEETGSFDKSFEFTFGGFTGINIHFFPNGSLLIKL